MIEALIKELKGTSEPFGIMMKKNEAFFNTLQMPEVQNSWKNFGETKTEGSFEKAVATYIVHNEQMILTTWSTMRVYEFAITRHMFCTEWATKMLDIIIEDRMKNSTDEAEKEALAKVKSELAEMKKVVADNQQYIDMLKIGVEKKNKWLNDNR